MRNKKDGRSEKTEESPPTRGGGIEKGVLITYVTIRCCDKKRGKGRKGWKNGKEI